jgi:hypothetical protein
MELEGSARDIISVRLQRMAERNHDKLHATPFGQNRNLSYVSGQF